MQEPHANGPLFVEMNFYIRAAKAELSKFLRCWSMDIFTLAHWKHQFLMDSFIYSFTRRTLF